MSRRDKTPLGRLERCLALGTPHHSKDAGTSSFGPDNGPDDATGNQQLCSVDTELLLEAVLQVAANHASDEVVE